MLCGATVEQMYQNESQLIHLINQLTDKQINITMDSLGTSMANNTSTCKFNVTVYMISMNTVTLTH